MNNQTRLLDHLRDDVEAIAKKGEPATWMTVDTTVASNVGLLHFGRAGSAATLLEIRFDFQAERARFDVSKNPPSKWFLSPTGRRIEWMAINYARAVDEQETNYDAVLGLIVEILAPELVERMARTSRAS